MLHSDKGTILKFGDLVNSDDIGVVELGGGPSLALESFQAILVAGKMRWQEFQRHPPVQLLVLGQVNLAHATKANLFQDCVTADPETRRKNYTGFRPVIFIILLLQKTPGSR